MKPILGGMALILLTAGCGGTASVAPTTKPSTPLPSSSVTAVPTPTTPTAKPTDSGPLKLGRALSTKDVRITVLQYRREAPGYGAAPGRRWDALSVKTCIVHGPLTLSWAPWSLADRSSGLYPASSSTYQGFLVPEYPFAGDRAFRKGDCAKGWIYFEVGKDARLTKATYGNDAGDVADWVLR